MANETTDTASHRPKRAIGVVASPTGIGWTFVTGDLFETPNVEEEQEIIPPANMTSRGEQLNWLFDETVRAIARLQPDMIVIEKPGAGFARGRVEIEGVIQIAAQRAQVPVEVLMKDSCRARLGRPAGGGAFKALLQELDVKARSNGPKRERYVFAKTALKLAGAE